MVALSRQYKAAVAMVWDSRRYRKRLSPLPNFTVREKKMLAANLVSSRTMLTANI